MLGIEAIDKSVDWTLFLDDDVLLPKDTLEKLEEIEEDAESIFL